MTLRLPLAPRADGRGGDDERAPRRRGALYIAERRFDSRSTTRSFRERLLLTPVAMLGDAAGLWLWKQVFGTDYDDGDDDG